MGFWQRVGYVIRTGKIKRPSHYIKRMDVYRRDRDYEKYQAAMKRIGADYGVVSSGDSSFVFNKGNRGGARYISTEKKVLSQEEIELFLELTEKHYNVSPQTGDYFFDIGSNIGTTAIFMAQQFKDINVVAFEPEPENYKLLLINSILNDCENIKSEKLAVSDKKGKLYFHVDSDASDSSAISETATAFEGDIEVDTISLDEYLESEGIPFERVKYLWVDVEGHELFALKGMRKLLHSRKIPLFMEFVPRFINREKVEQMVEELKDIYEEFFYVNFSGDEKGSMKLGSLVEFYEKNRSGLYNLFLY